MTVKLRNIHSNGSSFMQLETFGCRQFDVGYEFIDRIHQATDTVYSTLINPAAITDTCVTKRDPFRHHTHLPDIAVGVICGLGAGGYSNALQTAVKRLSQSN